jgi:hypothetical protein
MALNDPPVAVYRVGVTGHRHLRAPQTVAARCRETLQGILHDHPDAVACSALAIGADSLFAEAALALGMPLVAVIPFATYADDFTTPDERAQYERLLSSSTEVVRLPHARRSNAAYLAIGRWMVERCNLLVVIWDEQPSAGFGGTADVVALARRKGRPFIHIPAERSADASG